MKRIKRLIISSIIALSLFCSCSTMGHIQYVEVPKVKTEYVSKTDTTIIHDSIFVDRFRQNDTVFIYKYKYKYKTNIQRDTINKTDTVSVIKEVVVPEKYVPDYFHRVNVGFWVLLVITIGSVVFKVYRFIRRR